MIWWVRTLKQKAYVGGVAGDAGERPAGREERGVILRQVAFIAVWALTGLLVPRATIYEGMAPFGVGVAAAVSGPGALLAYIATAVGYLLPGDAVFPLRYVAAVLAVAGIRWSLSGFRELTDRAMFAPVIAFLATFSTGIAMNLVGGFAVDRLLMVLCESLVAGGFAYFSTATVRVIADAGSRTSLTAQEQSSLVATGAVLLMAVSSLEISGISPGRILAVVLILLLARCGREQGGSIAGIVLGLAMAMAAPDSLHLAAAYAFGGLMAGIFSRFGRLASAGIFVATNAIVAMSAGSGASVIIGVYEVAAASVLFVALPPVLDRYINRFFSHAQDLPAVEGLRRSVVMRLDFASKAMGEVATTVDSVSRKLAQISAPDMGTVYRQVSDDVCRLCGLRMHCWEGCFNETMDSFNHMSAVLREKGEIRRSEVTGRLERQCSRLDEVLAHVNRGYTEYLVREGAWRRLGEIRAVAAEQFTDMAGLLDELSLDFSETERMDVDAASRVRIICEQQGMLVSDAVCTLGRSDRMTVEILAEDAGLHIRERDWLRQIGDACGREFDHPTVARVGGTVRITLTERPLYAAQVATAQLQCTGEKLCGDAVETFSDAGHLHVVLSDGMGSGGRAAVDGAMAAGLTARLMQAGFGPDSVLRMVNAALMVKAEDESLATLDVLSVDLFTGRMESRKAGAAASLLRDNGRVSRIERSSLPIGILRDIRFEESCDTLTDGDVLLLLSDGALSCGTAWVEEALRDYDEEKEPLRQFAERVAHTAREKQAEDKEDDITVVAVRIVKKERRAAERAKRRPGAKSA